MTGPSAGRQDELRCLTQLLYKKVLQEPFPNARLRQKADPNLGSHKPSVQLK